jgi:starvation-inducible DNA-binding protein
MTDWSPAKAPKASLISILPPFPYSPCAISCAGGTTLAARNLSCPVDSTCFPIKEKTMKTTKAAKTASTATRASPPLSTPSDLKTEGTRDIADAMNGMLADVFALYLKTKNFHWHMSGPHFRDYHLLLDEQAVQVYAMVDIIAERIRKLGQPTLRSIGDIARRQRIRDNDAEFVEPGAMLAELQEDNKQLAANLRAAHDVCDDNRDIATASLIENWIDETEQRTWFLFEANRHSDSTGH